MSQRLNIFGKGQGLDGDLTSTGARCIASRARGQVHAIAWLLEGDKTTPCPRCGIEGTIIRGESRWRQDDIPTAVDGSLVQCGCPLGSNYVVAPLHQRPAPKSAVATQTYAPSFSSTPRASAQHAFNTFARDTSSAPGLEPGFHIVQYSQSFDQLLDRLAIHDRLLIKHLQRLNPNFAQGFKAGEIFVIGDPNNGHMCTREELHLMEAADLARDSLASLSDGEADFMMRHQAEIAGLLSDVSLAMGVSQAMMAKSLEELKNTLNYIEKLHQQQFSKHGHLRSPEFFAERKKLFKQLDVKLRMSFLNKTMDLGGHHGLRRDLGISSKSLVHHWSKAGGPSQIPGYTTHLDKLARISKYLERGGQVGIVIGAGASLLKVQEVCRAGETAACRKVRFTEAGSFAGGLGMGAYAGALAGDLTTVACFGLGPISATVCGIVLVGAGSLTGGYIGMSGGESIGEFIYEVTEP